MARTDRESQGRNGLLALLLVLLWAATTVDAPSAGPSREAGTDGASSIPDGDGRTALRPSRADLVDHRRIVVQQQRVGDQSPAPPSAGIDLKIPSAPGLAVVAGRGHDGTAGAPTVPRADAPRTAEARAPPVPA